MKIAVTGREGQVVRCLVEKAADHDGVAVVAIGRPEMDLADPLSVAAAIRRAAPDVVVSAAAYTAVDRAEDEPELAHQVNAVGAGAVAAAAAALDVPVIHLSTDYVFSGDSQIPYVESDPTGPQGVYGRSKLAGEAAVAAANPRHIILRTAWVYSAFGKNFLRTMLSLAESRDQLSVVCDQWGNPTSAHDIADGILHIAEFLRAAPAFDAYGVYHLTGQGSTNWADFADSIFAASRDAGGPSAAIVKIPTSGYPTKAKRPSNSRLSNQKLAEVFGWRSPEWTKSCAEVTGRLVRAV